MPETYDAALKTAKPGQIVGPFPVEGGFALVKVEDRRVEQPITLEAARPQIVRFLTYDQIRDLLEKLRGRAKVEVMVKTDTPQPGDPAGRRAQDRAAASARPDRRRPPSQRQGAEEMTRKPRRPSNPLNRPPRRWRPPRGPSRRSARRWSAPSTRWPARSSAPPSSAPTNRPAVHSATPAAPRRAGQGRHAGLAAGRAVPEDAADRRRPDGHRPGRLLQARARRPAGDELPGRGELRRGVHPPWRRLGAGRLVQAPSGDDQGRGRPRPGGQRRLRQLLHRPPGRRRRAPGLLGRGQALRLPPARRDGGLDRGDRRAAGRRQDRPPACRTSSTA